MCRSRWTSLLIVFLLLVAAGCDRPDRADPPRAHPTDERDENERNEDESAVDPPPDKSKRRWPRPTPPSISSDATAPDSSNLMQARDRYRRLVPRATPKSPERYTNLLHEGNNLVMRGRRKPDRGPYVKSGREIATAWRRYARGVRGLFVLRDSLYSQQDHPIENDPYSPILPPNWVTAVAHAAEHSEPFEAMSLPDVDDHAAWEAFEAPDELFEDLPASESLFDAATRDASALNEDSHALERALNARNTLHILDRDVRAMLEVVDDGPRAVAEVGADRIAASDRGYFGDEIRRARIIPISVENPNPKEIEEGKGLVPPGLEVSESLRSLVLETVYRRRLEDGDFALERYDISKPAERRRAVDVLERVIPEGADSGAEESTVWFWVTGTLDPNRKLRGEKPNEYIPQLRSMLREADVAMDRLQLVGKPSVELPKQGFEQALHDELERYNELDVPMSLFLRSAAPRLREVICCE